MEEGYANVQENIDTFIDDCRVLQLFGCKKTPDNPIVINKMMVH